MISLKIALEWFINPDHLPMIAGVALGKYQEARVDVKIIEPSEHYDGFEALKNGSIDIHCNEPLHLFEHYFDGIKSLGCFFETRGGVMLRLASVEKLKNGKQITITTPAANEVTNKIGYEILNRYAATQGFSLLEENVVFVQKDFWHIDNMLKDESLDGAWLCFYNFEGIEAKMRNFDYLFIDQFLSPYPNFSALEFITTQEVSHQKQNAIQKFIDITNEMALFCQQNPQDAKKIFYEYTNTTPSQLMDAIILDTLPRLQTKIYPDQNKWHTLYEFLEELHIVKLSDEQYQKIW